MLCMGAALSLSMNAQDPWLGLVAETEHTEGDLAGMTTYRLYVYTQNADDFVVSCSGDDENPSTSRALRSLRGSSMNWRPRPWLQM